MNKVLLICLCASISWLCSYSQNGITPLKIGDKLPPLVLKNVLNYPSQEILPADLKGKLVILDFWGVYCSSCLKEMPVMQEYQEKFKDKIKVLLVTADSKKDILKLRGNSKYFSQINLPIIYSDTILSKYFPHNAYGLHIWIDTTGTVRYRTDDRSYTASDIAHFLSGGEVSLTERTDTVKFNSEVPLWAEGNGRQMKHVQYYSLLTGNLSDYAGSRTRLLIDSATSKPVGVRFINCTRSLLLDMAYREWGNWMFDSVEYNLRDSSKYIYPEKGDQYKWLLENSVSYELEVPVSRSQDLFSIMQQDLKNYFQVISKKDSAQQQFLLLSTITDENKQQALNAQGDNKPLKTIFFSEFLSLVSNFKKLPIVKNKNNQFPAEIRIPVFNSNKDIDAFLNRMGFALSKESRTIKILKVTDISETGERN